jgi:hypothetical protein
MKGSNEGRQQKDHEDPQPLSFGLCARQGKGRGFLLLWMREADWKTKLFSLGIVEDYIVIRKS